MGDHPIWVRGNSTINIFPTVNHILEECMPCLHLHCMFPPQHEVCHTAGIRVLPEKRRVHSPVMNHTPAVPEAKRHHCIWG